MTRRWATTTAAILAATLSSGRAPAYTVTVEGNPSDWGLSVGKLPPNDNTGHLARGAGSGNNHVGEYVWRDPEGDERTEFSSPDQRIDLVSFHVTSDASNLYFAAIFSGAPDNGANRVTQLQIAVDRDRTVDSGETALGQGCDTSVAAEAAWEYLIVTRFGVGGGPFVFNTSSVDQNTGAASEGMDKVANAIEVGVPWSMIGGVPTAPLRFTVVTLRADNGDTAQDLAGGSDVLDAVTANGHPTVSANTSVEVQDGVVDHHFDLWFHLDPHTEPKAPLTISEVFAAADGAASWVELANISGEELSLSGFRLGDQADAAGSGEGMMLFPAGASVAAGQTQVVAGEADDYFAAYGFNPSFELADLDALVPDLIDDTQWDGAAVAPALAGDEVLLVDASFTVLDVVAWGTGAYPSVVAAAAPSAGQSLARSGVQRDSDNCGADLAALGSPTPRAPAAPCHDAFGAALAETTPCSLGDPCSTDACDAAGACIAGATIVCADDGNECTIDSCDSIYVLGCSRPVNAGVGCTDDTPDDCEAAECDGLGSCDQSHGDESAGTSCPDDDPDDCKAAQCDGNGVCDQLRGNEGLGASCPDTTPNDCKSAGCDGAGVCNQLHGNIGAGEACPDTTPEDCYGAVCNASGICIQTAEIRAATYECRPTQGLCDPPESCDGASPDCPADLLGSGECRASRGVCDPAEECDGVNAACPPDLKSTAECNPSAGACDVAERCDGVGDHCPADVKSTDECRGSQGACDPAERCDGVNDDCPADLKSSDVCRASAGVCDAAETCDGVSDDCPPDLKLSVECRGAIGPCDVAEVCDGATDSCPADLKSTAMCRPATHSCDLDEYCDGLGDACPDDLLAPMLTACDDGDPCTDKTRCDGQGICGAGLNVCGGSLRPDAGATADGGPAEDGGPNFDAAAPDLGVEDGAGGGGELPPPIDAAPGIGCGGCRSMGPGATPQWCFGLGLLFLLWSRLRVRW